MSLENSIQNELEHLYKWDAGHKVSQEAIKAFGVDKIFISIDISNEIFSRISGKSYKDNCTIPLEDLCYLKLLHYDLNLDIRIGEVICNKSIASDLINVFKDLYKLKYPIEKILLIDEYNADDEASMQDNNSSAFNFRQIVGGGKLSKHATGVAIDINPLYNPYVRKETNGNLYVAPENAGPFVDREKDFPYKINHQDICYQVFIKYGFKWGGDWETRKDYQHFEK